MSIKPKQIALDWISKNEDFLVKAHDKIWGWAEVGLQEYKTGIHNYVCFGLLKNRSLIIVDPVFHIQVSMYHSLPSLIVDRAIDQTEN